MIISLIGFVGNAQVNIDSLLSIWNDSSQPDSSRFRAIKAISYDGYLFTVPDTAFYYAQLHFDFADKVGIEKQKADALNTQGASWYIRGNGIKALEFYHRSLEIRRAINDKYGIGESLNNSGLIYKAQGDYETALEYLEESLEIRKDLDYKKGISAVTNNLGNIYSDKGNYLKAIESYKLSLKVSKELGDKMGMVNSNSNIGLIYQNQGKYSKAIEYYEKCLKLEDEINYLHGKAATLNNLGIINQRQDNHEVAGDYFEKSFRIREEMNDKVGMASCLNNMGINYQQKGDYAKALEYLTRSLRIKEEIGDKPEMASAFANMASVYDDLGLTEKALKYYARSLEIEEEFKSYEGMSTCLNNVGIIHLNKGEYNKAIKACERGLKNGLKVGFVEGIQTNAGTLYAAYKRSGNFKEALAKYELYISTRDSAESEENQKAVIRQEYKYQYEKQAIADSIQLAEAAKVKDAELAAEQAENKQHKLEAKQQEEQKYFLFGGLGLALLFGGFVFNRYRVTNKQKGIIEEQKEKVDAAYDELEEKNTEILDSINYAKRIQSAILPPEKLVKEYLSNSFILYKPKDIVAGDFYWMETKDNKVLFAAADCTGHGVPGAMVSVVCNNGLNRSVREHGLTDPGQILGKTREIVIAEFEKSEEDVKDGMDIALCSLEGHKLKYAGAHNPLWIIREEGTEVEEIKADKQPIGKYDNPKPYTTHTIQLNDGDSVYIFSDGYADQFGGEKGKKLKAANFKKLLLSIQTESMERQRELINDAFEKWMGNYEQLDDVCVIGVRV